ncbi:hypothetical protein JXB02_01875, partial [Candidatus Woesearchaeota archaeon]|nr:hypothetical protein [Candidatus Woesearchaeota archaeon]
MATPHADDPEARIRILREYLRRTEQYQRQLAQAIQELTAPLFYDEDRLHDLKSQLLYYQDLHAYYLTRMAECQQHAEAARLSRARIAKAAAAGALAFVLVGILLFGLWQQGIVGFVAFSSHAAGERVHLNVSGDETLTFAITDDDFSELQSFRVSGAVLPGGSARLWLVAGDTRLLVFDSSKLAAGPSLLTGLAVDDLVGQERNKSLSGSGTASLAVHETAVGRTLAAIPAPVANTSNLTLIGQPDGQGAAAGGQASLAFNETPAAIPDVPVPETPTILVNDTPEQDGDISSLTDSTASLALNETVPDMNITGASAQEDQSLMVNTIPEQHGNATFPPDGTASLAENETANATTPADTAVPENATGPTTDLTNETLPTLPPPRLPPDATEEENAGEEGLNVTEEVAEPANATEPMPRIEPIRFAEACVETCAIGLPAYEYELVFEVEGTTLAIDELSYIYATVERVNASVLLERNECLVGDPVEITVRTRNLAGHTLLITLPDGAAETLAETDDDSYSVSFIPSQEGLHTISLTAAGETLAEAFFEALPLPLDYPLTTDKASYLPLEPVGLSFPDVPGALLEILDPNGISYEQAEHMFYSTYSIGEYAVRLVRENETLNSTSFSVEMTLDAQLSTSVHNDTANLSLLLTTTAYGTDGPVRTFIDGADASFIVTDPLGVSYPLLAHLGTDEYTAAFVAASSGTHRVEADVSYAGMTAHAAGEFTIELPATENATNESIITFGDFAVIPTVEAPRPAGAVTTFAANSRTTLYPALGKGVYESSVGEENVLLPDGTYAPYVWNPDQLAARFADSEIRFRDEKIELWQGGEMLSAIGFALEKRGQGGWERLNASISDPSVTLGERDGTFTYSLSGADANLTVTMRFGGSRFVDFGYEVVAGSAGQYRLVWETDLDEEPVPVVMRHRGAEVTVGLRFDRSVILWKPEEAPDRSFEKEGRKVELSLGSYTLEKGSVKRISPDSWGPTAIANTNDDGADDDGGWNVDGIYGYHYLGAADGLQDVVAYRFRSVNLTGAHTILSANLTLQSFGDHWTPTTVYANFYGENSQTPADYSGGSPQARAKTAAYTPFQGQNYSDNEWYNISITEVLQELIGNYTYTGTQNISIIGNLTAHGGGYFAAAMDYYHGAAYTARLSVVYSTTPAAYGYLQADLTSNTTAADVTKDGSFTFTANVTCVGGDCGDVTAMLDPQVRMNASAGNAIVNVTMEGFAPMKLVYNESNGGAPYDIYLPSNDAKTVIAPNSAVARGIMFALVYNLACGTYFACIQTEDTSASITILEESPVRIGLLVEADLQSSSYGTTRQRVYLYPDRIISAHNTTGADNVNIGRGYLALGFNNTVIADNHYMFDNDTAPAGQTLDALAMFAHPAGVDYDEGTSLQVVKSGYTTVDLAIWDHNTPSEIVTYDEYAEVDDATDGRGVTLQVTDSAGLGAGETDEDVIGVLRLTTDDTADGTEARAYARDYWNPAVLSFTNGSSNTGDDGDIDADGFNDREAAYVIDTVRNYTRFNISGSAYPRYWPIFKLYGYTADEVYVLVTNGSEQYQLERDSGFIASHVNGSNSTGTLVVMLFANITDNSYVEMGDLKGIVPMDAGEPFYTTSQNPATDDDVSCLHNMHENESCAVTWTVVPTGAVETTYEFFVIFSSSFGAIEQNETAHVNLTIVPYTGPSVTLVSPADSSSDTDGTVAFLSNVTDDEHVVNATLFTNGSGWAAVETRWNGEVPWNDTGLVLLMHFNNESAFGEDNITFYDFSGNGNNGSGTGFENDEINASGKFGGSVTFDGDDDAMIIDDSPSLSLDDKITISVWIRPTGLGLGTDQAVINKGDYDSNYALFLDTGGALAEVKFWLYDGEAAGNTSLVGDAWNHIIATYNRTHMLVIQNGEIVALEPYTSAINTDDTDLYVSWDMYPFPGAVDELAIWNRSMTEAEMLAVYDYTKTRFYPVFQDVALADGGYLWNVRACDNGTNCTFASSNVSFTVGGGEGSGVKHVYYSVGTNTSDLKTGSPDVSISGGVATFTAAQADKVGVGDKINYSTSTMAYISGRTNGTVYSVVNATGGTPANVGTATVNSIKRAFNSLSAAESGASGAAYLGTSNLTQVNVTLNLACYGDGSDAAAVTVDGYVTGEENYINIYTPWNSSEVGASQRHDGVWDSGAYRLELASTVAVLSISDQHVRIDGLQINNTYDPDLAGPDGINVAEGADVRISNNIITRTGDGTPSSDGECGIYADNIAANSVVRIWNNIIYDYGISIFSDYVSSTGSTFYVYDNTIVDSFMQGVQIRDSVGDANLYLKNNLVFGSLGPFGNYFVTTFTNSNCSNNMGNGSSAPCSDPNYVECGDDGTDIFVDYANDDFHIKKTSDATDKGADLSADPYHSIIYDIDGDARSVPWDIGADELSGAAPTVTLIDPAQSDTESSPVTFLSNATDDAYVVNATLYTDEGGWSAKETRWNGEVPYNMSGLVALWHFNNESVVGEQYVGPVAGYYWVHDFSGNSLDLMRPGPDGADYYADVGRFGGAMEYDGGADWFLNISDPGTSSILDFNTSDSITLSLWVYPLVYEAGYQTILTKGSSSGGGNANYGLQTGPTGNATHHEIVFFFRDSGDTQWNEYVTADYHAPEYNWTHIAVTHTFGSGASTCVYVNGINVSGAWTGDGADDPFLSDDQLWIGDDNGGEAWDGYIDEVAIFNRTLSAAEISAIYDFTKDKFYPVFQQDTLAADTYSWNVYACDNASGCAFAVANNSFTVSDPCLTAGELNVSSTLSCSGYDMNVTGLNVLAGGSLTLDNSTLRVAGSANVYDGGSWTSKNSGGTLWFGGNVTINGTAVWNNETVRMNGTGDGRVGITVNGNLTVMNGSNITNGVTADAEYFFDINADGNLSLRDSFLSECGWTFTSPGLRLLNGGNVIYNTTFRENFDAVYINSDDNVFEKNNILSGEDGLLFGSVTNNTIYNNTIIVTDRGIDLNWLANGNNITNNIITADDGIRNRGGDDNWVYGNVIHTGDSADWAFTMVHGAQGNNYINNEIDMDAQVFLDAESGSYPANEIFLNNTFNRSCVLFQTDCTSLAPCELTVNWYLDVYVNDTAGSPLSSITVQINSSDGYTNYSGTTGADGRIGWTNVTEYTHAFNQVRNETHNNVTLYTNYTVTAFNATHADSVSWNLTGSALLNLTLGAGAGEAPAVTLVDPADGSTKYETSIEYLANVSDTRSIRDATLYTNTSGAWQAEETRWAGEVP